MFYGYDNEANMRKAFPDAADDLINRATKTQLRCCTYGKTSECVGYVDGKYIYKDGSKDDGEMRDKFSASLKNDMIVWGS